MGDLALKVFTIGGRVQLMIAGLNTGDAKVNMVKKLIEKSDEAFLLTLALCRMHVYLKDERPVEENAEPSEKKRGRRKGETEDEIGRHELVYKHIFEKVKAARNNTDQDGWYLAVAERLCRSIVSSDEERSDSLVGIDNAGPVHVLDSFDERSPVHYEMELLRIEQV